MKKMAMPIIEVVRFKETDVIVASTYANNFTLTNFGSKSGTGGVVGDGTITYDGKVYGNGGTGTMDQFLDIIASNGMNRRMVLSAPYTTTTPIRDIINREYTADRLSNNWNGTYIYDGYAFVRQQ